VPHASRQRTVGGRHVDAALAREAGVDGLIVLGAPVALGEHGRRDEDVDTFRHRRSERRAHRAFVATAPGYARDGLGVKDQARHCSS